MISHIDHLVLTVADIESSVTFYKRALLAGDSTFANGRRALHFGNQKINLQVLGMEKRNRAGVGSGDLCLVTTWPLSDVVAHLRGEGIEIIEGPVAKSGAVGPMMSVYFNDPDGNLIEISSYGARDGAGRIDDVRRDAGPGSRRGRRQGDFEMWTGILLLTAITALYAGYNLLVKVSSSHVPESATSTVLATICLQLAALAASCTFAILLLARGGHVLKLSPAAYAWAVGAGLCIGLAEIGYFYLFRGVGGSGPVAANVAIPAIVTGTVVLTMFISFFALKESLGAMQVAGTVVVIIGIAMIFSEGFGS